MPWKPGRELRPISDRSVWSHEAVENIHLLEVTGRVGVGSGRGVG